MPGAGRAGYRQKRAQTGAAGLRPQTPDHPRGQSHPSHLPQHPAHPLRGFQIEFQGRDHRCERLLVQEAFKIHRAGKMLVPIIDDAHLMPADCLRKLRLLCEDFPHSHNLVLIGQPPLLQSLALSINEEIRSRVTYSVVLLRLAPETIQSFILGQLDRAGLGHNTFTAEALALIIRSGEGLLRRTRNLCLSSLIEAVRDQTRTVELKQVNRVLIQPHWRKDCDNPLP